MIDINGDEIFKGDEVVFMAWANSHRQRMVTGKVVSVTTKCKDGSNRVKPFVSIDTLGEDGGYGDWTIENTKRYVCKLKKGKR